MKYTFCTITTVSHLYKTRALIYSVRKLLEADYYVLVTDGNSPDYDDAHYLDLSFLKTTVASEIIAKYKHQPDKLRWALKPVLMTSLLTNHCDTLIYTDNDIYFYSSPVFLFEKLKTSDVLLTPQFYSFDPTRNQIWFETNFMCGLYNAGFIAASKKGIPALDWWANCCKYNIKKSFWRGLYDDQKYLDMMPVAFKNIEIVKHKGCNITGWSLQNCTRGILHNETIILPNFPIIFIHFTPTFFFNIHEGKDPLLKGYFNQYIAALKVFNPAFEEKSQRKRKLIDYWGFLRFCLWKLTRVMK